MGLKVHHLALRYLHLNIYKLEFRGSGLTNDLQIYYSESLQDSRAKTKLLEENKTRAKCLLQ